MKLLDVAEFYCPLGGGVRTYVNQKMEQGAQLGWETVIVAPGPENREEQRANGKIVWVKAPQLPLDRRYHQFVTTRGIHRVIDQERPDILEASSPWLGGWAVAKWPGDCMKSFFLHSDPVAAYPQSLIGGWLGTDRVDRLFGWFWRYLRRLGSHFDTMVVGSEWMANRLERFDIPRPRVVKLGVDHTLFSPSLRDAGLRRDMLSICGVDDPAAPLVIAISRLHPEKKVGTILKAFAGASERRPMGLFLIGDGPRLKEVSREASRIPGVYLAGPVRDRQLLARCLASADVFLHGAGFETYGLVIAEAMRSGLPLVVPDTGGAAELAAPSYAETYPVGDGVAGAEALERILARDLPALREAAIAAEKRIPTPEGHFRELFNFYGTLARGFSPPRAATARDIVLAGGIPESKAEPV